VVVELSQPEVRFVAPRRPAPVCREEQPCAPKAPSIFHLTVNRLRSRLAGVGPAGVQQPVTTIIPAFATATIPIALQTTRFAAAGAEFGFAGAFRREAGELSRAEIEELVREALKRESARVSESAQQRDVCTELKERVARVEKRLEQIEKQVEGIAKKLDKLP
jgi:hypothetical protein